MDDYALSPARRSTGDLQKILESLMGGRGSVLCADLPNLLRTYEEQHGIVILDPPDYDNVVKQSETHPDLALDPENLFQFLSICTQLGRPEPSSPTPQLPHSASLPPNSFRQLQDKTPRPKKHNRRLSDRIRSPSDSSSSSGEDQSMRSRQRGERQSSAPPIPFPSSRSHANLPDLSERPLPPLPGQRLKTLSDASKNESPLSARIRSAGKNPPSSFGFGGATSFARPSPASRRRRGSTSGQSASGAEDAKSPDFPPASFNRSTSTGSFGMTSPAMSPTSPRSPMGIDNSSFLLRAKSPEMMSEVGAVEAEVMAMDDAGTLDGEEGSDADEIDALDSVQEMTEMDPRLSRLSTNSSGSLRTSHDKLRALQKQNTELARKLKDSEKQLAVLGAENERLVEDLQEKLEEARFEISQRRKDEKDWKGKERTMTIQISGYEADISSLQRSLENSKQNHASMQKMYNSQCDEAQRLRDLLRDRDVEIRDFEAAGQAHEADEQKYTNEIAALEAEIKRLETDLSSARQAEGFLETQKRENLQLKETIDRMRFDLDEARAAGSVMLGGGGHTRGPTSSSGPATLSRNLGDELQRRLLDAQKIREETVEEDGEEYVETVVTTQRKRKTGSKAATSAANPSAVVTIKEDVREYADVGTETEAPDEPDKPIAGPAKSAREEPPAYSREPAAESEKEVLLRHHPRVHDTSEDVDPEYATLVDSLGVRCKVLEEEMIKRGPLPNKGVDDASSDSVLRSMSRRKPHTRPGIVNYVFYQNDQLPALAFYVGAAMVVGISLGAKLFGAPSGIHPRDLELFSTMNSLALAAGGVGEGFVPGGRRVWEVARMAAGQVPS